MNVFPDGDGKNRVCVGKEIMNKLRKGARKGRRNGAELEAVNQRGESGWRERGEVSQMEKREGGELASSTGGG